MTVQEKTIVKMEMEGQGEYLESWSSFPHKTDLRVPRRHSADKKDGKEKLVDSDSSSWIPQHEAMDERVQG